MALKGSWNLGLSEELKTNFPDIRKIERPLVDNKKNYGPKLINRI